MVLIIFPLLYTSFSAYLPCLTMKVMIMVSLCQWIHMLH